MTDVVADRFTPNAAFAAVSGGGIWKTTDGGANWTRLWPDSNTQTMGAIAQAPNGTLWAGTGEANPPGGGLTYFGDGIYKSTDNGAPLDQHGADRQRGDRAHRGRSDELAAGVRRRPPGTSPARSRERGLYRTLDGGKTWQLVLAPPNATTGAIDVAINPTEPADRLRVAVGPHAQQRPRIYGGVGSGLFRSKDGGDTWERLENIVDPLPAYDRPRPA